RPTESRYASDYDTVVSSTVFTKPTASGMESLAISSMDGNTSMQANDTKTQRKQSTKRTKPQTTTKKDPRKKTTKGKALTTPPSLDQGSSQPANSSRFTANDNSVVGSSTVFTKPTPSGKNGTAS